MRNSQRGFYCLRELDATIQELETTMQYGRWKRFCGAEYPGLNAKRRKVVEEAFEREELEIDLPEYDLRSVATARDPLAVVEAHRLDCECVLIVLGATIHHGVVRICTVRICDPLVELWVAGLQWEEATNTKDMGRRITMHNFTLFAYTSTRRLPRLQPSYKRDCRKRSRWL